MNKDQLITKILKTHKYELMGYKHISPENLKENTYIKYYNIEKNELSKRADIRRIHYFSEITKTKPMKLELYDGVKHHWTIICKHHIIFRQFENTKNNDKLIHQFTDNYLQEQIDLYDQNDD
jgi:hypothetical protein